MSSVQNCGSHSIPDPKAKLTAIGTGTQWKNLIVEQELQITTTSVACAHDKCLLRAANEHGYDIPRGYQWLYPDLRRAEHTDSAIGDVHHVQVCHSVRLVDRRG